MKLNLGAGKDYKKGWTNVDIVKKFPTDIIADLRQPFPFKDSSIEEIFASDILEHFTKEEGVKFLKECYRVLMLNGVLTLRTHNIYQIFKQFASDAQVLIHFLYGATKETGEFGAHKYAYTKISLSLLLEKLGFEVLSFEEETTNFFVRAKKINKIDKKLHIAVIQQSPDIGGAETYMATLCKEFTARNNKITLVTDGKKFIELIKPYTNKQIKIPFTIDIIGDWKGLTKTIFKLPFAFIFYGKLLHKLREENIDVILMSGFSEKLLVTLLTKFMHFPIVWIEYAPLDVVFKRNFFLPKILYRLLGKIPASVIVPTSYTAQALMTSGKISQAKLAIIPCGIEISQKEQVSKLSIFSKEDFVIGNISRLTREKGQDILIRAMPEIIKKIPYAKLLLIGTGPDETYYQNLIKESHIEKSVVITGFVKDVKPYYSLINIFVFSSVWNLEGFGLVTIEAMSHKLPVIANSLPPIKTIIENDKTGILIDIKNQDQLINAVCELYNDTKKRNNLAKLGYEKVKADYNLEKISEDIIEVLSDAVLEQKVSQN